MTNLSIFNLTEHTAAGVAPAHPSLPMTLADAMAMIEQQKLALERVVHSHTESQQRLQAELEDAQLLHDISSMLVNEKSLDRLYQRIVEVATRIMRSDFGTLQRLDAERGELELIAQQGLNASRAGILGLGARRPRHHLRPGAGIGRTCHCCRFRDLRIYRR